MRNVQLGKSSLYVNPLGLGTNAVGGHNLYPSLDEKEGINLVQTAIKNGIDLIDSAFVYGHGRSEELVGKAVKEIGSRNEVVLSTKAAQRMINGKEVLDNSSAFLRQAVEDSLTRMQTDYIDLFYIHFPDGKTPGYEAVGTLKELKDEGLIRAIGISNMNLDQIKEANQDGYVDVIQDEYNLLNREAERHIFPYVRENKISFIPFFPFASGILTGKYDINKSFDEFDLRSGMPHYQGQVFQENLKKVEKLRPIANEKGIEVAHLVLAWYLKNDAINAIIPGAKTSKQVLDNLMALKVNILDTEVELIDGIFRLE